MSLTEIGQVRRQVREALTEAQDRPALSGTRMTTMLNSALSTSSMIWRLHAETAGAAAHWRITGISGACTSHP